MSEAEGIARAHRRVGEAEHAVERRMLQEAHNVDDSEHMRERAQALSEAADRHLAEARRRSDEQDPQDTP